MFPHLHLQYVGMVFGHSLSDQSNAACKNDMKDATISVINLKLLSPPQVLVSPMVMARYHLTYETMHCMSTAQLSRTLVSTFSPTCPVYLSVYLFISIYL